MKNIYTYIRIHFPIPSQVEEMGARGGRRLPVNGTENGEYNKIIVIYYFPEYL